MSAQFHVKHDDFFETIPFDEKNVQASSWMVLAGLTRGSKAGQITQKLKTSDTPGPPTSNPNQDHVESNNKTENNTILTDIHDELQNEQDTTREDQESVPASTALLGRSHRVKRYDSANARKSRATIMKHCCV